MRTTTKFALVALAGAAAVTGVACSLGLNENLIPGGDAGNDVSVDAVIDAPNPVQCKADPDCKSTNGCLTGKCAQNQCTYTLCPTNTCNASVCDNTSHTCSAPAAYSFHAGTFHVAQPLNNGCGAGGRCFAAVYPFVFLGTSNGVIAYGVADPTTTNPTPIPVAGLPFIPTYIVANAATVYFVGPVVGPGPSYYMPIAWLTVPTDPTVTEMNATTVFDTLPYTQIDAVFPDTAGGIYMIRGDVSKSYPATRVVAPLADLQTLSFQGTPLVPTNANIAAASGTRFVTIRQDNGTLFDTHFSLEVSAATASAQNAGEQSLIASEGSPTYAPSYLAQGPSGGLLWTTNAVDINDAGGIIAYTGARLAWVLADNNATKFDATTHIDMTTYSTTATSDLAGPAAWIDTNTAIAISAAQSNIMQSVVQVGSRNGTPSVVPNKSFQLAWHPSQLSVTASNGFGYVLTPDQTQGVNVHVFNTACNN
jgi:hypothetical protein